MVAAQVDEAQEVRRADVPLAAGPIQPLGDLGQQGVGVIPAGAVNPRIQPANALTLTGHRRAPLTHCAVLGAQVAEVGGRHLQGLDPRDRAARLRLRALQADRPGLAGLTGLVHLTHLAHLARLPGLPGALRLLAGPRAPAEPAQPAGADEPAGLVALLAPVGLDVVVRAHAMPPRFLGHWSPTRYSATVGSPSWVSPRASPRAGRASTKLMWAAPGSIQPRSASSDTGEVRST